MMVADSKTELTRWSWHVLVVLLAGVVLLATAACASAPGRVVEAESSLTSGADPAATSQRQVRIHQLPKPELRLPRAVWGDHLQLSVESRNMIGDVHIQVYGPQAHQTATVVKPENHLRGKRYRADIEISGWPDGEVLVTATAYAAASSDETQQQVSDDNQQDRSTVAAEITWQATATTRLINEVAAKWSATERAEIATWVAADATDPPIWGRRPLWRNLDRALFSSVPLHRLQGMVLRSYDWPQFQRRQPYTLYVPSTYQPQQAMPVMVLLHGSGGDHRNIIADHHAGQDLEQFPMLIANAGAFPHEEYRHLARIDVMLMLQHLAQHYHIDPQRIYIQGISLGGRGALDVAAAHPDVFAGISAQGVYGLLDHIIDPTLQPHDRPAQLLRQRADLRTILPNLHHIPTQVVLGWQDRNTPPELGRVVAKALKYHGNKQVDLLQVDQGHNLTLPEVNWAKTREWWLKQPAKPMLREEIISQPASLRFGRNGWLLLKAQQNYADVARITARREDDTIQITTHNVKEFALAAGSWPASWGIRRVMIDEQRLDLTGDHLVSIIGNTKSQEMGQHMSQEQGNNEGSNNTPAQAEGARKPNSLHQDQSHDASPHQSSPEENTPSDPFAESPLVAGSPLLLASLDPIWLHRPSGQQWHAATTTSVQLTHKRPGLSGPLWDSFNNTQVAVIDDRDQQQAGLLEAAAAGWLQWWANTPPAEFPHQRLSTMGATPPAAHLILVSHDLESHPWLINHHPLPVPFTTDYDQDIRIAIRPAPWDPRFSLTLIEIRRNLKHAGPLLYRLRQWDVALHADWLSLDRQPIGRTKSGKVVYGPYLRHSGSYDHDWQHDPAATTTTHWPQGYYLGPAARGD